MRPEDEVEAVEEFFQLDSRYYQPLYIANNLRIPFERTVFYLRELCLDGFLRKHGRYYGRHRQ